MKKVRHKFNATPTVKDNIRFDSKAESRYYEKLKAIQKNGDLVFFYDNRPFIYQVVLNT